MTTTTTADTILAIDLGRLKCVRCADARANLAATFVTLDTSLGDFEQPFARHCPFFSSCTPWGDRAGMTDFT